jgi:SLOG cluster2/TIR domain
MPFPIPIQVHVIWHPDSEDNCFPLAKKLYVALNRDSYQPLVPGIGIPVFFRCAGANPARPNDVPAPIAVPDTEYDLRVALTAPKLLLEQAWCKYVADNFTEVAHKRDRATMLVFGKPVPNCAVRAVVMDLKEQLAGEQILQHVLLQACRLLSQRLLPEGAGNLGAAPLRLFLSHTKRDKLGLKVAQAVKKYLDGMAVDRFFDEVSIQPGDDIGSELKRSIADSALVAIRTDGYVASPWCRKEVALAKQARRPMAVLDALVDKEARSSPFLANLPSIRIGVDTIDDTAQLERIANFLGLEVLRFLHAERQLHLLKQQNLVAEHAILLPRQPEPRDLAVLLGATVPSRTFVHPDPVLSAEESEEYAAYRANFITPTSVWSKKLTGLQLGISVSLGDPKEERALGLSSPLHVEDATRIVARQALAAGATLVYGGALAMKPGQPGQLTEALFEMFGAYNKSGLINAPPLINYAAWPWSEEVDDEWLASRLEMLTVKAWPRPEDLADPDVEPGPGKFLRLAKTPQGGYVLARSLSAMRAELTARTQARVVLGGKPHSFMGIMPGLIEEALLTIRRRQPLYVMGGFGGAAGLLAQAMLGQHPAGLTVDFQKAKSPAYAEVMKVYERERSCQPALNLPAIDYPAIVQELDAYGLAGLAATNGLSKQENRELFATGSIDSALFLLMKGLSSISPGPRSG